MPEPITLVVGGIALYAFLKGKSTVPLADLTAEERDEILSQAPSSALATQTPLVIIPPGALQTSGSTIAAEDGIPLGASLNAGAALDTAELTVPADLVAALDADTALRFRQYAALNPADFEAFLDRYADRIVLRNDLMLERLTNPQAGEPDIELSPGMLIGMGTAAYKVAQAINGVAVGRSVDLFGVTASAAGQIPGLNQDFVSSLQGLAMGYRAITSITQVMQIAAANQVGVSTMMGWGSTSLGAVGAYPGLAALPLAGVLMAVGLVVDIGFTIIGDKPDLQKAIDVALDVASLAVLFIPVIGIVIAIIIQLVKFIIDLFGEDLFGGGMSKEQREILEAAKYGERLNPMFPALANCYTPRELFRTIIEWGSGYCGGKQIVAMAVNVILRAGDQFMAGGQLVTVPLEMDGTSFGPGNNEQAGGCYWIKAWANTSMPQLANITNDEQAILLGVYAPVNGTIARAQLGVTEGALKEQFNDPTERLIMTRAQPMRDFLVKHRMSLDEIDQIALEYRAQPHLTTLAASFGWATWQELLAYCVEHEWYAFNATVTNGSLSDFARQNGYPSMYALRAAAFAPFEIYYTPARAAATRLLSFIDMYLGGEMYTAMKNVYDAQINEGQWVVPPASPLIEVLA